jgi:hypothetical protein
MVPRQPPDPVPEQPPAEKPEGAVWIPGYWTWDDDRTDFLWVSGFWRTPPASHKWVPGSWTRAARGWRWVSGYWGSLTIDPPYLDEPPASLDVGPSVPPPDEGSLYVPGTWVPGDGRFRWRPGNWIAPRAGVVYTPARYCWTPRGCVFVDGYWDGPLGARGVLTAPVYFPRPFAWRPGWSYQPGYAVLPSALVGNLWVRPAWNSYCFGDYYGPRYQRLGYRPWPTTAVAAQDPLLTYYRWSNRTNPNWSRELTSTFEARTRGTAPLPPRTLAAQSALRPITVGQRVLVPVADYRPARSGEVQRVAATSERVPSLSVDRLPGPAVRPALTPTTPPVMVPPATSSLDTRGPRTTALIPAPSGDGRRIVIGGELIPGPAAIRGTLPRSAPAVRPATTITRPLTPPPVAAVGRPGAPGAGVSRPLAPRTAPRAQAPRVPTRPAPRR